MSSESRTGARIWAGVSVSLVLLFATSIGWAATEPKYGGVLNATESDAPPSLSIHEEATVSTVWPMMPCYNNLVLFDPLKKQESVQTLIGELAEKWAWEDGGKALVFHLRKSVKWHDGQPFSSKDVKYTFDVIREVPGAQAKLRVNPRKLWYENVASVDTPDPDTVIFRLNRPQPSLLLMLGSGYAPIYPAHVAPAELRTRCVGTGPFKLKEFRPGEYIELVKNPDYMIKGRPYLDGIRYVIVRERSTRFSALQAGRLDVSYPSELARTISESTKQANPRLVMVETSTNVNDNILLNFKRPIFQDARIRRAINLAIDRRDYIKAGRQGGAVPGGVMLPKPYGVWGLSEKDLVKLPGMGEAAKNKAEAKKLLADAGYGPVKPLKLTVQTRTTSYFLDVASFVIDQLKQVGIDPTLEQVEMGVWHAKLTRRDYELAANNTGIGPDDPDANLYENFKCGSPRNYSDFCNPEVDRLIDEQSATLDFAKRLTLVQELDRRLQLEGARIMLGWAQEYYLMWPYVKNLVPHQSEYNYGRMQEVWLDK